MHCGDTLSEVLEARAGGFEIATGNHFNKVGAIRGSHGVLVPFGASLGAGCEAVRGFPHQKYFVAENANNLVSHAWIPAQ